MQFHGNSFLLSYSLATEFISELQLLLSKILINTISDILDDGGNIRKQMLKTTTALTQVCIDQISFQDKFFQEIRRKYLWPHQFDDQS